MTDELEVIALEPLWDGSGNYVHIKYRLLINFLRMICKVIRI